MSTPEHAPLVWLPFRPELLEDPPTGLRYEVVDPSEHVPDSVTEVAFYVTPYRVTPEVSDVLPRMTNLQVVQTLSAGVDNVHDRIPASATLCSGRGIHDSSTAELTLALVLGSLRGLPEFVRAQDRGEWGYEWRPALADRRVLLIGYGAVGAAIEARLRPFEVDVVRVARNARPGVHAFTELPELLPDADVAILIVPLTDETRGLVDADFLARLPDAALVVNMARGAVVDTDALLAELESGRLRAAADVFDTEPLPADSPLWRAPNLLISPHVGGASSAMWPRAYELVRDQLQRYVVGQPLANRITGAY